MANTPQVGLIPNGYVKLSDAFQEWIIEVLRRDGLNVHGSPLDSKTTEEFNQGIEDRRWQALTKHAHEAEDTISRAVRHYYGTRPLSVWTRAGAHLEPELMDPPLFNSTGWVQHNTIVSGFMIAYQSDYDRWPLFLKVDEWRDWKSRQLTNDNPPEKSSAVTIAAETECRDWLKNEFEKDPLNRKVKRSFKEDALAQFSGRPSNRGFDRAWASVAPDAGRSSAGRKSAPQ